MDYLVYVSHDAENLQFWLWLQDYTRRFYAAPRSEQVLSPPWYQVEAPHPLGNATEAARTSDKKHPIVSQYNVNFDNVEQTTTPQFDKQSFMSGPNSNQSVADSVEDANHQMGLKWQSCTLFSFSWTVQC